MTLRPFRFAVQTGPFQDPIALRTFAQQIEALGYDELYSFDHIGRRGNAAVDPFVPLLIAAEATTTLRVGPLVLNNELHHPALLARTAISVDQMTSGRLVLGLGTGYAQVEHDAIGMQLLPPGQRVSRFAESLQIVRSLCDNGSCSYSGEYHTVAVEEMGIRPTQEHIPFLIGGHGKRVVGLAGRHADIFQFTGLVHAEDGTPTAGGFPFDQIQQRAQWLADAAGDRDADIERSSLAQLTALDADAPDDNTLIERYKMDADEIAKTPFVLVGSTEQVVDKIERLREQLGISHYVVRDPEGFAPIVEALARR